MIGISAYAPFKMSPIETTIEISYMMKAPLQKSLGVLSLDIALRTMKSFKFNKEAPKPNA